MNSSISSCGKSSGLRVSSSDPSDAADAEASASQRAETPAAWMRGTLSVPDYEPLHFFSRATDDCSPASQSDADQICELSIRLKEVELCKIMAEAPDTQETIVVEEPHRGPSVHRQWSVPEQRHVHPWYPGCFQRPMMAMRPVQVVHFLPHADIHQFWPRPPVFRCPMVIWQPVQVPPHLCPIIRWNFPCGCIH